MNRFSTGYFNRSGLTIAASMVLVGIVDLVRTFRNHDRSEAVAVAVIFFIVMPAFALWARRLPPTDGKTEGNSPSFR
jgi:hypothetical protein